MYIDPETVQRRIDVAELEMNEVKILRAARRNIKMSKVMAVALEQISLINSEQLTTFKTKQIRDILCETRRKVAKLDEEKMGLGE